MEDRVLTVSASKKQLDVMLKKVKRFDSAEFVGVLSKFKKYDYVIYDANGNQAMYKAIKAVCELKTGRQYKTVAVNTKQRAVVRV
jgi:hypothetical protein